MRRKLLDVLAEPATGKPLTLVPDDGADIILEGELVSESGRRYPIVNGIPRFVRSENYSESFGLQWTRFAEVQLDSRTGASYSRRRFENEVPWATQLAGEWVIDAGCGAGRFAEIAAAKGAEVLAVDLSNAVDAVQHHLGHMPNVHPVQADLRLLPFRRDAVRHLYSIGVLQHTPDPPEAARALVEFLPAGGRFAFTIYGRRPWTRLYSKYWFRPVTRRLPPQTLLRAVESAMPVLFPVTSFLFRLPTVGRVFQFVIPVANYVDHTDVSADIRYREAVLDTFDMLAPAFDSPVTRPELKRALEGAAATLQFVSEVPVIVHGTAAGG